MFKPDRKFKKLATQYGTCAYIYRDGISLFERRRVKSGQYETEININHYWPCDIRLHSGYGDMKVKRIVVHNPEMLLSGLESVQVYYDGGSQKSKEKGLRVVSAHFKAPNGMEWNALDTDFLSMAITVQPSPLNFGTYSGPDSIADCIQYDKEHYENFELVPA